MKIWRTGVVGLAMLWLAGCGGGSEPLAPSTAAWKQASTLAATADTTSAALVTADMTLDWAQYRFPELFDGARAQYMPAVSYQGQTYNARAYAGAWGIRYLGITPDGRVFGLGDFTNERLQQFDTISHWAPQVLSDWCAVRPSDCAAGAAGYGSVAPVAAATQVLDKVASSGDGAALSVGLDDGSRVDLGAQPAAFVAQLEREAGTDAALRSALANVPGLQTTGSVRGLYLSGSNTVSDLIPTITVPASEALGLNPDTLMALRLGPALVEGQMVTEHLSLLPVSRDALGNWSFVDPLFRDGLYQNGGAAAAPARAPARTASGRLRSNAADYQWIGGARYVLTSFQNDLNWSREPELVRMVADPTQSASGWRRPATDAEKADLARQPICNLVLLVHGHNEEEQAGNTTPTEAAPWMQSYKKRLWEVLYQVALSRDNQGQANYPVACTAFYEFIFPSYRAIFSPVSVKGGGVQETLGEALGRLVKDELTRNKQLGAMLDTGMPLNTVIVAHSQGGLVARAGLRHMPDKFKAQVKRLVTWGSPHHGAPMYTMRYAMLAGHDMVVDGYRLPFQNWAQNKIAAKALDTPGIRDLRVDIRFKDTMNLQAIFPSMDAKAQAALESRLFSSNLAEFNAVVGGREIEPGPYYTFLTGTKQRSAELEVEDAGGWWAQVRKQQVLKFMASTETEQGAAVNKLLMKSGYGASDGAAPVASQQGAGIYGPETVDMGDIDHEEFYGAEPPLRNAASLYKGVLTAERSLQKARMDAAENACPSIQGLELSTTPGNVRIIGRASFPSLAKTPERSAALIERIEARVNSRSGAVIDALVFQVDTRGSFSASAASSVVPAGPVLVLVVLKDGSEMSGLVEQNGAAVFDATRVFDQPWTITENREGLLRAQLTQNYNGATLQCTMQVNWALPTTHDQPLQLNIEQQIMRDGALFRSNFFVKYLNYRGRVMPRGDGTFATRLVDAVDPSSTIVRTDLGTRRDISILAPERLESSFYDAIPTAAVIVRGLCSPVEEMSFRFDYRLP